MAVIRLVENKRSFVRIVLDDGTEYKILKSLYAERPVQPEEEVDPEEFSHWILVHQYRPALNYAVSLLAVRPRSKKEIADKLRLKGYSAETSEMVLYKLEKEALLNDEEFTDQWVESRSGMKYGPNRILRELRQKGITQEKAEAAVDAISEDTLLEQAVSLAEKAHARMKPDEDPRKAFQRISSALIRRGFGWDLARQACNQVLGDPDD